MKMIIDAVFVLVNKTKTIKDVTRDDVKCIDFVKRKVEMNKTTLRKHFFLCILHASDIYKHYEGMTGPSLQYSVCLPFLSYAL